MEYPIGCMIIVPVQDQNGEFIIENGQRKEDLYPGYILGMESKFHTDGNIWVTYEVVDMKGKIMWLDSSEVAYVISDVHERFRKVKQ